MSDTLMTASGILHDVNNHLQIILGHTALLLETPDLIQKPKQFKKALEVLDIAARDAALSVHRLRACYRPETASPPLQPLNLNALVRQAVALTQPKWKTSGKTIRIKTHLKKVPPVSGSEPELREALINLILNAVDAIQSKGTITLRTYARKDQVMLEVQDTGAGMTENILKQALDPFFTTKPTGTGLGLWRVNEMVNRYRGVLALSSAPGRGTTVRMAFPFLKDAL